MSFRAKRLIKYFMILCILFTTTPDEEHHPILHEEVEAVVKALKMGKSSGVDNIPAELVHAGGEAMIS